MNKFRKMSAYLDKITDFWFIYSLVNSLYPLTTSYKYIQWIFVLLTNHYAFSTPPLCHLFPEVSHLPPWGQGYHNCSNFSYQFLRFIVLSTYKKKIKNKKSNLKRKGFILIHSSPLCHENHCDRISKRLIMSYPQSEKKEQ